MHLYRAFGLRIASAIPLPALEHASGAGAADLQMLLGPVIDRLPEPCERQRIDDVTFETAPGRCLIRLASGTRFLVEDGSRIVVHLAPGAGLGEVRTFLLGSCVAATLHQRGILALHGSAIDTPRGAVLFLGHSGKGKSTLAASFLRRGAGLISDDLCAVEQDAEGERVLPAYPRLKLCHDAFDRLGGREAVDRDPEKRVAVPEIFVDTPRPLLAVVQLRMFAVHRLTMEHLTASAACRVLDANIYRRSLVAGLDVGDTLARSIARLARSVPVYRTVRPLDTDSLAELTEMVAGEIESGRLRDRTAREAVPAQRTSRFQHAPAAIAGRVGEGLVVRHLDVDGYFQLDPIGVRVWELLTTPLTRAEVCGHLLHEYDVSPADCERDVGALLTDLHARGLIEHTPS